MLKDTTYISTFAVMSRRCFTYEGDDLVASERVSRLCKSTRRRSTQSKSIRQSHTVLETVIQLHPDSVACLDLDNSLPLESYLRISEIGSLHIRNNGEAQLAVFKSGMMATISELAICASRASWGHTHYELIDDEIATRKTARVIVI
jgi:predicted sugar kinase